MARWTKRRMYFDEKTGLYRSHTSDRVLTVEQYKARCAQGKIAAAASKAQAAYLASEDYQRDVAEMMARQEARKDRPMIRLPGMSDWQHGHHVAVDRAMRNFRRRS